VRCPDLYVCKLSLTACQLWQAVRLSTVVLASEPCSMAQCTLHQKLYEYLYCQMALNSHTIINYLICRVKLYECVLID